MVALAAAEVQHPNLGTGSQADPKEKQLRPIVPLVLYQGGRRWRHGREFSELFARPVRQWPGVPRYAHLLIDQTKARPDQVRGELRGRITQLAMMAAFHRLKHELEAAGDSSPHPD